MEIKKVKNGWEYDGLIFKKKSDALEAQKSTEQGDSLPRSLKKISKSPTTIYDSEKHTSFGYFVAQFIKKQSGKTSIVSLAGKIGVSKQTLFKWINGESLPSHKHTMQIRSAMKCSEEELYFALKTNLQIHMARILGTKLNNIKKLDKKYKEKIAS